MKIICNKEEFAGMLSTCYGNTYSGDGCTLCRLIDADEIEKCVHEWYDVGEYVFADTIRNADTIIEAEVSE